MPRLDVRQLITNTSRFIQSIQFPHEPLVLSCPEAQATEGDPPPRHREIYFWPPLLPIPPVSPMLPMPPRIYTASKFHSMRRVPVEIESCLAEKYCNAWNRMWDYCFRSRAYSLEQLLWDLQWLFWNRYGRSRGAIWPYGPPPADSPRDEAAAWPYPPAPEFMPEHAMPN